MGTVSLVFSLEVRAVQESEQAFETRRSSSPVLEFKNVCQYFNDKNGGIVTAAEDINLSIMYGEVMALVGESRLMERRPLGGFQLGWESRAKVRFCLTVKTSQVTRSWS